ncbi:MAG: hypothetical protein JRC86_08715, partial [Deltaproteobacteria bacterium]|nr:hypothetical protein [Deltaproteobacteria bacterium]
MSLKEALLAKHVDLLLQEAGLRLVERPMVRDGQRFITHRWMHGEDKSMGVQHEAGKGVSMTHHAWDRMEHDARGTYDGVRQGIQDLATRKLPDKNWYYCVPSIVHGQCRTFLTGHGNHITTVLSSDMLPRGEEIKKHLEAEALIKEFALLKERKACPAGQHRHVLTGHSGFENKCHPEDQVHRGEHHEDVAAPKRDRLVTVYHWTTKAEAAKIREEGLRPGSFVSTDEGTAWDLRQRGGKEAEEVVSFKVRRSELEADELAAEEGTRGSYEYQPKTAPETAGRRGLEAEARKYDTFEEFEKAWLHEIKHGQYWHITHDKDFEIDSAKGPRDMSSLGVGATSKGKLMITSDLENWADSYAAGEKPREYAALIDMSGVPKEAYKQVSRGFGNEFFVTSPQQAQTVTVVSLVEARKLSARWEKDKPQSSEELHRFYDAAHSIPDDVQKAKDDHPAQWDLWFRLMDLYHSIVNPMERKSSDVTLLCMLLNEFWCNVDALSAEIYSEPQERESAFLDAMAVAREALHFAHTEDEKVQAIDAIMQMPFMVDPTLIPALCGYGTADLDSYVAMGHLTKTILLE